MQQIAAADRWRRLSWNTADTRPGEQFAYYREAICQAFMNLTPEPPATPGFVARVETVGARRRRGQPGQFPGACRAALGRRYRRVHTALLLPQSQAGRPLPHPAGRARGQPVAGPGRNLRQRRRFSLLHDRGPALQVASFWVPAEALDERLPSAPEAAPARVSDDPFVGHLIAETAQVLNSALRASDTDNARLFGVLLDLVALSLSRTGRAGVAESAGLADGRGSRCAVPWTAGCASPAWA